MIPLDDRGLLLGDGLFETLLARDGALMLFDEHLALMVEGCAVLGLPPPDGAAALALCRAALAEAGLENARAAVRLTLTAGSGGRGLDRPTTPRPRLLATAAPAPPPGEPTDLVTVSVRRNEGSPASRLKTLAYVDNVLARRQAAPAEALMLNNAGEVACAAAANIFWLEGGRLLTPHPDAGARPGVMRGQAMAAAGDLGLVVRQVLAPREALSSAEGLFLTNSLTGVRPVVRLDGVTLPVPSVVEDLMRRLEHFPISVKRLSDRKML